MDKTINIAKQTNTILEVDASPSRLDLHDEYIRLAIENGCKLSIDSDAHDISHMRFLKFGIAQARRGWAEEKDIVNTLPLKKFLKLLKFSASASEVNPRSDFMFSLHFKKLQISNEACSRQIYNCLKEAGRCNCCKPAAS